MKVGIAVVQMKPERYDVEGNVSKMLQFMEKVKDERPETHLIVFPELITSGYECGKRFQDLAEVAPVGPSIKAVASQSQKLKVNAVFGFPERSATMKEVLYNSAAFVSDKGEVVGVYRKVHLFDTEKGPFRPGCDYPLFQTDIGNIGIMICWDTAFPEVARIYALKGAQLIVIPTNWEKPYSYDWDLIVSARAFDNTIYIAGANRIGQDEILGFFGHSRIVDPLGRPLVALDEEVEGYGFAEVDYDEALRLKHEYYTLLKDRRPDTYDEIIKKY